MDDPALNKDDAVKLHLRALAREELDHKELAALETSGYRWLRFPPKIERVYQAEERLINLKFWRMASSIVLLAFMSFIFLDPFYYPEGYWVNWVFRLCFILPTCLWALMRSYRVNTVMAGPRDIFVPFTLAAIGVVLFSLGAGHHQLMGFVGLMIIVPLAFGLRLMDYWCANLMSLVTLVVFLTGSVFFSALEAGEIVGQSVYLMVAIIVSAMMGYRGEHMARNNFLVRHRLAAEQKRLAALSQQDGLTGLANRRTLDQALTKEWNRSQRSGESIGLLMIDVDFFKPYNDTYGHLAGDETLRKVADAILRCARRSGDLAARYGGEEFCVLASGVDEMGAAVLAEKIRASVEALGIPHSKSKTAKVVTVSIGLAVCVPEQDQELSGLVKQADELLYLAKKNGRNQVSTSSGEKLD